jgi:hypothetical protein
LPISDGEAWALLLRFWSSALRDLLCRKAELYAIFYIASQWVIWWRDSYFELTMMADFVVGRL